MFLGYLTNYLIRLSLSANVAVNKQISEVILMLGNDAILMVYQIYAHYNTYTGNSTFRHINRACTL